MSWKDIQEVLLFGMAPSQRWRLLMALAIVVFAAHTLWAHGVYDANEGFVTQNRAERIAQAAASEAAQKVREEILTSLNALRSELLADKMQAWHYTRCRSDDSNLKEQLTRQISKAASRFRRINGYHYQLTPCVDL